MDSGNSGSMQSSSGGDEDFDSSSRGESISSFLNPSSNFGSITATQHPQFLTHQNPNFFDPQNTHNNLDHHHHPFPQSSNATNTYNDNNNDLIWSRGFRSQHNYGNFGNLSTDSSSLPSRTTQSLASSEQRPFRSPSSAVPLRPDSEGGHASKASLGSDHLPGVIKNPKKRTRASRRAPTTVLTTDTANFRQMVQEFTGIPAAPLSGSLYSRRLDLFSAAAALRSGTHLDTLGPLYPLRPSAGHKVLSPFSSSTPPPPPSLLNSTMIDSTVPTNTTTTTTTHLGASTSNNYSLPSNHLLNLQQQLGGNTTMNFGNLSGFLSQETPSRVRDNGETARNNDGVQENLVGFDGIINSSDSQRISGYNLNISDEGTENAVAEGNVGSWICPSD